MSQIATPYYIVYEDRLRRNIELIKSVMDHAGVKIIMAFKANALWKTFPIFREYGICSTASSVNEMLTFPMLGISASLYVQERGSQG